MGTRVKRILEDIYGIMEIGFKARKWAGG